MKNPFDMLKWIHHYASHYAQFPGLFKDVATFDEDGNEAAGKSKLSVIIDFLYIFFMLKMLPHNYYLFRFNRKPRKEFKNYMDGPVAPLMKHRLYASLWNDSYCCLVNDKYLFHCFCRYHGITVPEVYGVYSGGSLKSDGCSLKDVMERHGLSKVILKPLHGMQGKGIYFVTNNGKEVVASAVLPEEYPFHPRDFSEGDFLVQEVVKQHPALDRVNPHCLNTIRIVTLLTRDNKVEFLGAMLRTNSGTLPIDNFSLGGIVIKVDIASGKLKGRGLLKGRHAKEFSSHPLTGVVFEGLEIPYWKELKESAAKAQKIFGELKALGWDFAVTAGGPTLIEGNIEWGTTGIQATNGGLLTEKNRALFSQYSLKFHE